MKLSTDVDFCLNEPAPQTSTEGAEEEGVVQDGIEDVGVEDDG